MTIHRDPDKEKERRQAKDDKEKKDKAEESQEETAPRVIKHIDIKV